MIPLPSLSFAVQLQHTGIRVGPSAFPAPLWSTFTLQLLLAPAQHFLFHPGEIQMLGQSRGDLDVLFVTKP